MLFAARVGDPTTHAGVVSGPGVPNVLIGGLPAAVLGDTHTCGLRPIPHAPTPVVATMGSVLIGGRPPLRFGDTAGCGAMIIVGAFNVLIGGRQP